MKYLDSQKRFLNAIQCRKNNRKEVEAFLTNGWSVKDVEDYLYELVPPSPKEKMPETQYSIQVDDYIIHEWGGGFVVMDGLLFEDLIIRIPENYLEELTIEHQELGIKVFNFEKFIDTMDSKLDKNEHDEEDLELAKKQLEAMQEYEYVLYQRILLLEEKGIVK